ncbi:MAG: restriction endonuclease subunit S [Betaproteobacteria bacterium]|nr:restriction endonuclease subunit S [Betaproteobacteria bacterium]
MSMTLDQVSLTGSMHVPRGWRSVTLDDIVSDDGVFVDGDWVESKDQDPAGDVRLIQLADVGDGEYRDRSERFLTSEKASDLGCTFLQPGDLLIARMPDPLGRACIFPGDRKRAVTVVDVAVVRPRNSEVNARWLMYCINAPQFRRVVASLQSGSTRQRISRKNLAKIVFPLPPLYWQDEVVAEIEKQFSRLDEAIAYLKRLRASLKRYKAAVLKAAVGGRLVSSAGASDADAPAADGPSPENGLPPSWRWSTVGELARVGTGATPSRSKALYWSGGDVPWVTSAAVNEPYVDAATEFATQAALLETNLTLYPPGTLLVAMYGEGKTRGKCTELRIAATTNQALAALQVAEGLRPYLKLYLDHSYEDMRKVASGGVQPNLNLGLLRALRVPLPPPGEQNRIVAEVARRLSVAHEVAAQVDANLRRADALRRATLANSFALSI